MDAKVICGVFMTLLFFLASFYYWKCRREISAFNTELEKILKSDSVDAALNESALLAFAWRIFKKTLTRTNDKIYSTVDAAEFFSTQNLLRGMNMTFWQNYGGIFTGLGILGTFAGLTLGLDGVNMTSGDIDFAGWNWRGSFVQCDS